MAHAALGQLVTNAVRGAAFALFLLGAAGSASAQARDPLKWPFASTSIWNMPIGSDAVYVPANIPAIPYTNDPNDPNYWRPVPWMDEEIIVLAPTAPLTDINYSDAAWRGGDRCNATGGLLFQLPMPSNFTVPNGVTSNSAAFLKPDGRTLIQMQPFTRCTAGLSGTSLTTPSDFPPVDLYGDGVRGSRAGSGLSAIGGSIRLGELRPGSQGPRHALKVALYSAQVLYKCVTPGDCYRWPADRADAIAVGSYGTVSDNNNAAMKMGALLAIAASVDLSTMGLETEPGRQLAWTLQNYGAYIDDSTGEPAFVIDAETGPDGSLDAQFQADWGFPIAQRAGWDLPWSRDIQRLMTALSVVDNNSPTSIGGGGTPRQPLAPPLMMTRSEEDSAVHSGWVRRGAEVAAFSSGFAVSSDVTGAAATFIFTGTAVNWIGLKCNVCGITNVSVDGGAMISIDTAGPAVPGSPGLASEVVLTTSGLAAGTHTLNITVTGSSSSGGAHIVVDAFDVTP